MTGRHRSGSGAHETRGAQSRHRVIDFARAIVALATVLLAAACSPQLHVGSDVYERYSFEGRDSFSWVSEHPMVASSPDVSPFAEDRIKQAIVDAMQTKGIRYVADPAQAKLLVGFSLSSKEKMRVTPAPYPYWWGGRYPWVGTYYNHVDLERYTVGQLTIDVFDVEDKKPVWHGWASKVLSDDAHLTGQRAPKAVNAILADFPPGTGSRKH